MPSTIKLTENAAERIKLILDGHDEALGVRVGVKVKGCSGLSYVINYAKEGEEDLKKFEEVKSHGVRVFIDPKAARHVVGTEMDWQDTNMSSEFVFNNPNSKGSCGCGKSFIV